MISNITVFTYEHIIYAFLYKCYLGTDWLVKKVERATNKIKGEELFLVFETCQIEREGCELSFSQTKELGLRILWWLTIGIAFRNFAIPDTNEKGLQSALLFRLDHKAVY